LVSQQHDALQRGSDATLAQIEVRIVAETRNYGLALGRMAVRWESEGGTPPSVWTRDARAYARDYDGQRALVWADASMTLQRVEPLPGNRGLVGLDLGGIRVARRALDDARRSGTVLASPIFEVPDVGAVALLCAPIFIDGVSDGFVIAVLAAQEFLESVIDPRVRGSYDVALYEGGHTLRLGDQRGMGDTWIASAEIDASGLTGSLAVWPTASTVAAGESGLPGGVLLIGLLMAASTALVVYFGQAARRTTRALAAVNVELATASERSEGRLKAVVDTAADGIITADATGAIESFNPAAERMFGYAAQEVVGRNLRMLMPEPYHSAHDGYLKRYADTRVPAVIGSGREVVGRRKDGSTFAMHLSVSEMILPEGKRFAGIIRDISDLKRIDAQRTQLLHRVMTMQEVERARVAEGLHEQIGQELTAVVLGLRTAEASTSLEDARAVVAEVRGQASDTIEDVRLMAVQMRPGALADLGLAAVLDSDVQTLAEHEGFVARVDLDESHALALSQDAQLSLYRIIHAALDNVVSHAHASHVIITIRPDNDRVSVMVQDDGIGFDVDPLDSADGPASVGLLAMRERARMMRGSVNIESTQGEGTVVFIDVPNDAA
jgi:PAS domain S-box-containing protein